MIGYAIYYKDKDGFDILYDSDGKFCIYSSESLAKEYLEIFKSKAYEIWRPTPETVPGGLFGRKKTVYSQIDPIKSAYGRQVYITIFIKKVKVI